MNMLLCWPLVGWLPRKGPVGSNKKEAILSQVTILDVFAISRKIFVFGGHFSKWTFAEGRSTRSLWCLETIQGPIWRSNDHFVMKGLSKNVKNHRFSRNPLFGETENWRPGVYFDAEYVSAPFCRVKTPWIAIWSNIFVFGRKTVFFQFFYLLAL